MLILAADIGTGTQDILLFDSEKEVENSLLMVMPAPTQVTAEKVRKATREGKVDSAYREHNGRRPFYICYQGSSQGRFSGICY